MPGSALASEAASRWVSIVVADALSAADKAAEDVSKGLCGIDAERVHGISPGDSTSTSKDRDRHVSVLPSIAEAVSPEAATPRTLLETVASLQAKVNTSRDVQHLVNGTGCLSQHETHGLGETTLKAQAEMIEWSMSMLLVEVAQLFSHMDKNISVLKKMQEQQTQHPTEQQCQDLVVSISSMVCSHFDKQFEKVSQQQEQQISKLSQLVCNVHNMELREELSKSSLGPLPLTPQCSKMPSCSVPPVTTQSARARTDSSGNEGCSAAKLLLPASGEEAPDGMVTSPSRRQAGIEAPAVLAPTSRSFKELPLGSLNLSAVDRSAPQDGGSLANTFPRVGSGDGSARNLHAREQLQSSVSPLSRLSLWPREMPEAKTLSQWARTTRANTTVFAAPPFTSRSALAATRASQSQNQMTHVRSNSEDWGSSFPTLGCSACMSSKSPASRGLPTVRCADGNPVSDGLSNGVTEAGCVSPSDPPHGQQTVEPLSS